MKYMVIVWNIGDCCVNVSTYDNSKEAKECYDAYVEEVGDHNVVLTKSLTTIDNEHTFR